MEKNLTAALEAALFAAGSDGASPNDLRKALGADAEQLNAAVKALTKGKEKGGDSGLLVANFGGRLKLVTKPEHNAVCASLLAARTKAALSPGALEVLAIVAYNQPCPRKKIEDLRGASSVSILEGLLERDLIVGDERAETPGKPILYETTHKFLDLLGLKSVAELPKMAGGGLPSLDADFFHAERDLPPEEN